MSVAYGCVFTVLAALAALVAVLAPEWVLRAVGAATAFSFLLVALAYFGTGPRLLFKRANGRRFVWAWVVHWPYFVLTAFSYRLSILISREAAYVSVAPNVFLGRRLTAREARRAAAEGWVAVLDLAAELSEPGALRTMANYRSLPVLDATAMSRAQLCEAVEWLKRHTATGPVYVHCAMGHSRSALVAAAYLLAVGLAPDAPSALKQLRALRSGVRLRRPQREALNRFAGEAGTTSAPCR
jgi:hypothetical protein